MSKFLVIELRFTFTLLNGYFVYSDLLLGLHFMTLDLFFHTLMMLPHQDNAEKCKRQYPHKGG